MGDGGGEKLTWLVHPTFVRGSGPAGAHRAADRPGCLQHRDRRKGGATGNTVIAWRACYGQADIAGLADHDRSGRPGGSTTARMSPPRSECRRRSSASPLALAHARGAVGYRPQHRGQCPARVWGGPVAGGHLQVLHRSRAGGQGRRRGRFLPGPTRERGGAIPGRKPTHPGP